MYEELVKGLREATGWKNASVHYSLMNEAADAIEELSRFKEECDGCGDKVRSAIEKLQKMIPHWIPVTERLPEKYTHNLVYSNETGIDILYFGSRGLFQDYHSDEIKGITHWMPLPGMPKEEV